MRNENKSFGSRKCARKHKSAPDNRNCITAPSAEHLTARIILIIIITVRSAVRVAFGPAAAGAGTKAQTAVDRGPGQSLSYSYS